MRVKDARRRDGFQLSQLEMSQLEKDRWRWVHGTRSTGSSMNREKQKVDMQGTPFEAGNSKGSLNERIELLKQSKEEEPPAEKNGE